MRNEVEPARTGNIERIELVAKHAEEISLMVQKLGTALARGEFEDLKNILNEIKQRVAEIENHLSMLDSEQDS
ncbi:MAG: hypothetical protein QXU09_02695 [Thermoproteota archaeon]